MAKAEWGAKRECPSCGTRYYDLGKEPPVCPRCGTEYNAASMKAGYQAPPPPVDRGKAKPGQRVVPAEEAGEVEDVIVPDEEEADEFVEEDDDFVEDEAEDEVFEPEPDEK